MAGVCTVNGTALTSYPVTSLEGWADDIEGEMPSTALPGLHKQYVEPELETVRPRIIRIGLLVKPASVAARGAAVNTLLALFPRRSRLTLTFDDDSAKEARGYVTGATVVAETPEQGFVNPNAVALLTVTCYDPAKYDTSDTVTAFTTATQIPTGTLPHGGVIRVTGTAGGISDPLITYKNGAGTTVATMGFDIDIAENDYLEIDLDAKTVKKSVSSVISNAIGTWNAGDFFLIDPADYNSTTPPSLTKNVGTCQLTHRKKYRS